MTTKPISIIPFQLYRCLPPLPRLSIASGCLLTVFMWLFSANVHAVTDVTLTILNATDSNGNLTIINGSKIKVRYVINNPESGTFKSSDKIQLVRVDSDEVVDSVQRGKKNKGTVTLKARGSIDEALYVRYLLKGSGAEVVRTSHPQDGGHIPMASIDKPSLNNVAIEASALDERIAANAANIIDNFNMAMANEDDIDAIEDRLQQDIWIAVNSRSVVANVESTTQANECTLNYAINDVFGVRFFNTGTVTSNCDMITGVSLPHNSTVKEIKCRQRPTASGAGIVLASSPIAGGTIENTTHAGIAAPSTTNAIIQTSTTNVFTPTVDNEVRNYFIRVDIVSPDFSGIGAGANFGFYGCAIRVTPASL